MGCHFLLQGIFPTQVSCTAGGFQCTVAHHFHATKGNHTTNAPSAPLLHTYVPPGPSLLIADSIFHLAARMILLKHEPGCFSQVLRVNTKSTSGFQSRTLPDPVLKHTQIFPTCCSLLLDLFFTQIATFFSISGSLGFCSNINLQLRPSLATRFCI